MPETIASSVALLRFLYVQRVKGFDPPREPHLDPEVIAWLREQLSKAQLYLEFGSGGSTVLASSLGVPTISVESDRFYAPAVRRALPHPEIVKTITPRMGLTREWGMPVFFRSKKGERYVTAPFGRPQSSFPDLVLVDGRYRTACVLQTAREAHRAKASATLLLDDYEGRPYAAALEPLLGQPERIERAAIFVVGHRPISETEVRKHMYDPR